MAVGVNLAAAKAWPGYGKVPQCSPEAGVTCSSRAMHAPRFASAAFTRLRLAALRSPLRENGTKARPAPAKGPAQRGSRVRL